MKKHPRVGNALPVATRPMRDDAKGYSFAKIAKDAIYEPRGRRPLAGTAILAVVTGGGPGHR